MSIPNITLLDPDETKTYSIDFSTGLAAGETLVTNSLSITPSGLRNSIPAITGSSLVVAFSGGSEGETYVAGAKVYTSLGNVLDECINIAVRSCGWLEEIVIMLRYLIGDLGSEPVYSDLRLAQTLLVAAKYVQLDINMSQTYTINASQLKITPNPTTLSPPDIAFMNFMVLKAACILDTVSLRAAAKTGGLVAQLGPAKLDTSKYIEGFRIVMENGPCNTYLNEIFNYNLDSLSTQAILGPFVGNNFYPRHQYLTWRP